MKFKQKIKEIKTNLFEPGDLLQVALVIQCNTLPLDVELRGFIFQARDLLLFYLQILKQNRKFESQTWDDIIELSE